jgi:small subunit ribosomal protein S16
MVRIRLRRIGSTHQPYYRVVVADQESPRDGRFIEIVGQYHPKTHPSTIVFNDERIFYWLSVGAQASESVKKLFKIVKLDERYAKYVKDGDNSKLYDEAKALYEKRNTGSKTSQGIEAPVKSTKAPKKKED